MPHKYVLVYDGAGDDHINGGRTPDVNAPTLPGEFWQEVDKATYKLVADNLHWPASSLWKYQRVASGGDVHENVALIPDPRFIVKLTRPAALIEAGIAATFTLDYFNSSGAINPPGTIPIVMYVQNRQTLALRFERFSPNGRGVGGEQFPFTFDETGEWRFGIHASDQDEYRLTADEANYSPVIVYVYEALATQAKP